MNQETLLKIVKTWNLNPKQEYRGFRCANCQEYLHKAWHHWLIIRDVYKTPVHFCQKCEKEFRLGKIKISKPAAPVNKSRFNLKRFPENTTIKLKEIIRSWKIKSKPIYKIFTCDDCGLNMYQAYHVWFILKEILSEVHFCHKCGRKFNL